MARVIRFAPQLGHWLAQNLDRGQQPAALVETMRRQGMEASAAEAIVAATVDARLRGVAPPVDSIELADDESPKQAARLAPGTTSCAWACTTGRST